MPAAHASLLHQLPESRYPETGARVPRAGIPKNIDHRYPPRQSRAKQRLFVEGASTGTGFECLRSAVASGLSVVGLVSSEERGERVKAFGGQPTNRKAPEFASCFTTVPDDPKEVAEWVKQGEAFVKDVHEKAGGPIDAVVSHAGEKAFRFRICCSKAGPRRDLRSSSTTAPARKTASWTRSESRRSRSPAT